MRRILQVKNGVAMSEWSGTGPLPVPTDGTWTFVDVTERPSAQVGDSYNGFTDTFTAPTVPDYGATVDARAFQLLFTTAERIAIRTAAASNEVIADWARLAELPLPIRLKHPNTLAGLAGLVAATLLTEERATAISNNEPPA